jgi:hypothetical protein
MDSGGLEGVGSILQVELGNTEGLT